MEQRTKKYFDEDFKDWKKRVRSYLPEIAIALYTAKNNGVFVPYETEKLLGVVIKEINNPFYTISDDRGNLIDNISKTGLRVILELQVEELFQFVNTNCKELKELC